MSNCVSQTTQAQDRLNHTLAVFAGTTGSGSVADGAPGTGKLWNPSGFCYSPVTGMRYCTSAYANRIYFISAGGYLTCVSGAAVGHADGQGTSATFSSPRGICSDPSGNLYVADYANHEIRKIDTGINVTTLAGSYATPGNTNGAYGTGTLTGPTGICYYGGYLYVADTGCGSIRKVDPTTGYLTTVGSGLTLSGPTSICVDSQGTFTIADAGNNRIVQMDQSYNMTVLAGQATAGGADGTGASAQFNSPDGVAVNAQGHVYVSDGSAAKTIRFITSSGVVTTICGTYGTTVYAFLGTPMCLGFGPDGFLYIPDKATHVINKMT